MQFLLVIALLIAFAPITFVLWLRVDDLADRYEEARPGSRVRRAMARQIGAAAGWWLIYSGAILAAMGGGFIGAGPFLTLGAALVVLAVIAKRRNDAPLFWAAA